MEYKQVFYNCDMCDRKHFVTAKWKPKSELKLEDFHDVSLKDEMTAVMLRLIEEKFKEAHPEGVFDPSLIRIGGE